MKRRFDLSYLLLVPLLLRACSPWFQYRSKAIIVVPFFVLWYFFQIAKPMRFNLRFWFNVRKMCFFFFFATVTYFGLLPLLYGGIDLSVHVGRGVFNKSSITGLVMQLAFVFIVYWSIVRHKFRELRFLGILVLLSLLQIGVSTLLFGDEVAGGASRAMVAIDNGDLAMGSTKLSLYEGAQVIGEYGLGGYSYAYLAAFLTPAFFYSALKITPKPLKILCLLTALSSIVIVFKGGLQTPIVVLVLGLFMLVCAVLFKLRKGLIVLGGAAMLGVALFIVQPKCYAFLGPVLRGAAELTEKIEYRERLVSLAAAVEGDKLTYAYQRYRLQARSWKGFCEHPFLGGGPEADMGGHSELLDTMSCYGSIGLLVLISLFVYFYKFNNALGRTALGKEWLTMVCGYMGLLIFASITNPVSIFPPVIILIFPALALSYPGAPLDGSVYKEGQSPCLR